MLLLKNSFASVIMDYRYSIQHKEHIMKNFKVSGLTVKTSEKDLRAALGKLGKLADLKITGGVAEVEFSEEVDSAGIGEIKLPDGTKLHVSEMPRSGNIRPA